MEPTGGLGKPKGKRAKLRHLGGKAQRRSRVFLSGLAMCALSVLVAVPAGASSGPPQPAATSAAVASAVKAALKQNSLPNSLTPSLMDVAGNNVYAMQGTAFLKRDCDPYNYRNEVFNPQPCIYGSTSSKKTIVIFGDSYVGNWLPALNEVGKNLGYRIAAFEFAGCITSFFTRPAGTKLTAFDQACDEWHTHLPAAVRAQHPFAIVAANGTPSWGVGGDPGWIQGIKKAFDEMTTTSPHAIRVLISISPSLPSPAPSCLAAYASSIQKCDLVYQPGKLGSGLFSASLIRDENAAASAGAMLLPTVQWFCANDRCPAVIDHMLVYVDNDHLSIVYSEYLWKVFEQELEPVLQHA